MAQTPGNDPALLDPRPGAALPDLPGARPLAAELARTDAAVAHAARRLGFGDEPGQFPHALRRLAAPAA